MEPNHPTPSALRTLPAELAGQLQANEETDDKLRENMMHVEAVIKLIAPNYGLKTVALRRKKPNPFQARDLLPQYSGTSERRA